MSLKFALFALLVISAQGFIQAHSHEAKEIQPRDITEELEKLVKQLVEEVRAAVDAALKRIKQLYDELAEETKEKVQAALEDIKKLVAETKAELEKILEEAAEIGEAAKQCVDAELPNIEKLERESAEKMQVCANAIMTDVQEAKDIIESTVKNSVAAIKGLVEEFQNCGNVICKIGVISRISSTLNTIKNNATQAVEDVKAIIAEAVPAAQACVGKVVSEHAVESQAITNRVRECINKIGA